MSLKEYGLALTELMPKLPRPHEEDLVRQLVNIARGGNATQKARAGRALERLDVSVLGPESAGALTEYKKSIESGPSTA